MIAYLDMPSGISGDMFLGCLVDAGWSIDELRAVITEMALPPEEWSVTARVVQKGALRGTLVDVQVQEGPTHRHLADVAEIIQKAELSQSVKDGAIRVFTRLAEAEAWVHGTSVEEVHFHEVGALDAIIDIVGAVAGMEALGISQLYASGAPLGEGWTNSAHGKIPLPAPATLRILTEVQAPNRRAPGPGELVTPTGAALVAEFAQFEQPLMTLQKTGYGAGQKEFEWPNLARLWLGQSNQPETHRQKDSRSQPAECVVIETNIDDMNPEFYGLARERLLAAGALDVWTTPIQMKKERPGILLSILAPATEKATFAELVLRETTTLGVRIYPVHRHMAERAFEQVQTEYGPVTIKKKFLNGEFIGLKPEYEDCLNLATAQNIPLRVVQEKAQFEAYRSLLDDRNDRINSV